MAAHGRKGNPGVEADKRFEHAQELLLPTVATYLAMYSRHDAGFMLTAYRLVLPFPEAGYSHATNSLMNCPKNEKRIL